MGYEKTSSQYEHHIEDGSETGVVFSIRYKKLENNQCREPAVIARFELFGCDCPCRQKNHTAGGTYIAKQYTKIVMSAQMQLYIQMKGKIPEDSLVLKSVDFFKKKTTKRELQNLKLGK